MRKLKLQVQTTVDGYMAGPDGAMDWVAHPWTADIEQYIDDLTEAMNRLKAEPGDDLIVYGGSTLVTGLVGHGLVDELHLFVNPTAVGDGLRVFPGEAGYQRLRLVAARPFDCGITALHLAPQPA